MSNSLLDSVLWYSGAAVAIAGLALILWALGWDRARGRRRCPRCWYDMAGVPGLTCPECGRAVRTEKRLARTRRHWVSAAAGVAVLLAGAVSTRVPAYRQGGWVGLVPSSVLVWWAPADTLAFGSVSQQAAATLGQALGNTGGWVLPTPNVPLPGLTVGEKLSVEVWTRLYRGRLWGWQARVFVHRCLRRSGDPMPWEVVFAERWPAGVPVRAIVKPTAGYSTLASWSDLELWINDAPPGERKPGPGRPRGEVFVLPGAVHLAKGNTVRLRATIRDTVVFERNWLLPCALVRTPEEMVSPIGDPEFTPNARRALDPTLAGQEERMVLVVSDRGANDPWPDLDAAIVFEGEVLVDGGIVARSATERVERIRPVWKNWLEVPLEWVGDGRERLAAARDRAEIRVRGNRSEAALVFLAAPFSQPNNLFWSGEFTVPARWGPIERPRPSGNP